MTILLKILIAHLIGVFFTTAYILGKIQRREKNQIPLDLCSSFYPHRSPLLFYLG